MIVADTNAVAELMKAVPDALVRGWFKRHLPDGVTTTSITVAEIRFGIARLPAGRRRDQMGLAADRVFDEFDGGYLSFDVPAAEAYAQVVSECERGGAPVEGFDVQIAAICLVHDALLATRNVRDFAGTGVRTVDPWLG